MEIQAFKFTGTGIKELLTAFIRNYCGEVYESSYEGGILWAYEDYTILNNNYLMVCIRLDSSLSDKGIIRLEIIAGGASDGYFAIGNWGSEERRVNKLRNKLIDFCEENNIDMEDED